MNEIWKDIEGYEGLYQVSNFGRIKILEKIRIMPNGGSRIYKEKISKGDKVTGGYLSIKLCKYGDVKRYMIHRLVACEFIKNEFCKPQINHIDGNKTNNYIDNLEWVTAKENTIHAYKLKLNKSERPVIQINMKNEVVNTFQSTRDAERETGINHSGISYTCLGNYKQYKGYKWRFI